MRRITATVAGLSAVVGLVIGVARLVSLLPDEARTKTIPVLVYSYAILIGLVSFCVFGSLLVVRSRERHGTILISKSVYAALLTAGQGTFAATAVGILIPLIDRVPSKGRTDPWVVVTGVLLVLITIGTAWRIDRTWERMRQDREQQCRHCMEWVHLEATRCRYCTADIGSERAQAMTP